MNVPFQSGGPVYSGMCSETGSRMQMTIESLGNEIAHLRQENAELKRGAIANMASLNESGKFLMEIAKDLQRHKAALEKCREALVGWHKYFQSDIPKTADQQECQAEQFTSAWFDAEEAIKSAESLSTPPNPQPTQDPATDK